MNKEPSYNDIRNRVKRDGGDGGGNHVEQDVFQKFLSKYTHNTFNVVHTV